MKKKLFYLRVWWLRLFNRKATHCFFYSEGQRNVSISWEVKHTLPLFKDIEYTEMRGFEYGPSNWEDAKLLGIGTTEDVTFNKI
jgi:hypothetical protein